MRKIIHIQRYRKSGRTERELWRLLSSLRRDKRRKDRELERLLWSLRLLTGE
ncbi:MAG: hypothetical protein AMXMBFR33_20460 [Candidatus Xenobia bacterium]